MVPPVIALVGKPDCGKTTLLEKLLPELSRRGYRVGTIKHHVHEFAMDIPGKDTWRHKQAGAHTVALSSPTGIGLIKDTDHDLGVDELVARYFGELDLVLTEGYKHTSLPKIEVYRREIHPEPLAGRDDSWIAMVSDTPLGGDLPCFGPDQVEAIVDLLKQRFLAPVKLPMAKAPATITLTVDGNPISLNRFAADLLQRGILGMIASLRGCEDPQTVSISVNNRPDHG